MIDLPPAQHVTPITEACIERSAESMGISTDLIQAILQVEGGRIGMASKNTNGTYDLGPMQINTIWIKYFKKKGITAHDLRNNGCMNVLAGSHIAAQEISRAGNLSLGIARYHSPTPKHQRRYLSKVVGALNNKLSLKKLLGRANKR